MNMREQFLGGHYMARSVNSSDNWMVNLYPETVPNASGGKDVGALYRCAGLTSLVTCGAGPVRGLWVLGGFLYVASGSTLYSVSTTWTATSIGTIAGSGPVFMADNGTQIFVSCTPTAYIYNTATAVFAQITDADFPGSGCVGYIDGYFVFNQPNTQKFWNTAINDGTNIDALDFASAEGAPDNLVALLVDHQEIWNFGGLSTEVWYNTGNTDNTFARIQGAIIEHGCAAPASVAKMDNSVFWLGADDRGQGILWRANGYTPVRVSDHSAEFAWSEFDTIADAVAYTYQDQGHAFYVISFPTGDQTWVLDAATNLMHRRAYRNTTTGDLTRHRSNCHAFFNAKHVVGDYSTGVLYSLDPTVYTDNGDPQVWIRRWRALPTGSNNLNRTFHHALEISAEMGVGTGATGPTVDPQVLLRWSDDGGHTWSNGKSASLGRSGRYANMVRFNRLGTSRDRVYELSSSAAVKITLIGAQLEMTKAFS